MLRSRLCTLATAAFVAAFVLGSHLLAADEPAAKAQKKLSSEEAIRGALVKPVTLEYTKKPLSEVAADLEAKLGVPVRLDVKALKGIGITADTPVTFAISDVSAKAAIYWMLRDLGLTSVVRYEVLWITTPEEAENIEKTIVYEVSDVIFGGATPDQADFDGLIEVIKTCVRPTSWPDGTGPGPISTFEAVGIKAIVVLQTQDVQDEIESLLSQLRAICDGRAASQSPSGAVPSKPQEPASPELSAGAGFVVLEVSASEKMVRETLEKPVNLQVKDTPLVQVIEQLKKIANLPIVLDRKAMANLGVDPTTPVTLDASNRTLRAILDEMTHQHGLAWTFDHEVLLVTTPEEEECLLVTRAYDIADLLSYHNERGENAADFDTIIGMIEVSIEPTHWDDTGGAGSIGAFEGDAIHAIMVRQAWQIHLKLESLLANLRQVRGHARNEEHIEKRPPVHRTQEPGMGKDMM